MGFVRAVCRYATIGRPFFVHGIQNKTTPVAAEKVKMRANFFRFASKIRSLQDPFIPNTGRGFLARPPSALGVMSSSTHGAGFLPKDVRNFGEGGAPTNISNGGNLNL